MTRFRPRGQELLIYICRLLAKLARSSFVLSGTHSRPSHSASMMWHIPGKLWTIGQTIQGTNCERGTLCVPYEPRYRHSKDGRYVLEYNAIEYSMSLSGIYTCLIAPAVFQTSPTHNMQTSLLPTNMSCRQRVPVVRRIAIFHRPCITELVLHTHATDCIFSSRRWRIYMASMSESPGSLHTKYQVQFFMATHRDICLDYTASTKSMIARFTLDVRITFSCG